MCGLGCIVKREEKQRSPSLVEMVTELSALKSMKLLQYLHFSPLCVYHLSDGIFNEWLDLSIHI